MPGIFMYHNMAILKYLIRLRKIIDGDEGQNVQG